MHGHPNFTGTWVLTKISFKVPFLFAYFSNNWFRQEKGDIGEVGKHWSLWYLQRMWQRWRGYLFTVSTENIGRCDILFEIPFGIFATPGIRRKNFTMFSWHFRTKHLSRLFVSLVLLYLHCYEIFSIYSGTGYSKSELNYKTKSLRTPPIYWCVCATIQRKIDTKSIFCCVLFPKIVVGVCYIRLSSLELKVIHIVVVFWVVRSI